MTFGNLRAGPLVLSGTFGEADVSGGQRNVIWAARPAAVWKALQSQGHVVAAVFVPPWALALGEAEWTLALALAPGVALPLGAGLAARRRGPPPGLRQIEGMAVFVLLFVVVAILAVPGFLALGMPPLDALFESVSGITSTGLTLAQNTMDWPLAGHLLRAWMQWAGGFAIAVAGVALILGPGSGSRGAAQSIGQAGIGERDLISSTRAQARSLLIVYGLLTMAAILLLLPLMPSWWEAVAVALTAVSTGGFTPRPDSLASYGTAAQVATLVICAATAVSLLGYIIAERSGPRLALRKSNAGPVLALLLAGLALTAGLAWRAGADPEGILAAALNYASGATTAGFSVSAVSNAPAVVAMILAGMVIGGGIGSTAGGLKVDRLVVFARTVTLTSVRMRAPPRAVTVLEEHGHKVSPDRLIGMVAVALLYAGTLLAAWVIFLAAGQDALGALFDIVSALSTVGLSSGLTGPDLAPGLKAVLIAAMLLGRLEFIALLVVLSPGTWSPRPFQNSRKGA
ncbi:TrkH family potassium uptake protein [Histidinibacterium lentulum]|nr:TrkH family potassium uptake protein [Histidinibacterium lentulum]